MKKKKLPIVFTILVLVLLVTGVLLLKEEKVTFNEDGNFRILQINDFQDTDETDPKSIEFLNALLDKYEPDLVVIVGDQLSDVFENPTQEKIKTAIRNQLQPMEDRNIPFLYTYGNHDRDYEDVLSIEEQETVYQEFSTCLNTKGSYPGTCNLVIYGKNGITPKLNIYMMDTHDWNKSGEDTGINKYQLAWYQGISNWLKLQNGGEPLPSLLFQHIPVKEIHRLFQVVEKDHPNAVKCRFSEDWFILNEKLRWIGEENIMREAPSCENFIVMTNQYQYWLEQGDIIGAYFAHDHFNNFVGETPDGLILGYNPSFGFATYGADDEERHARIYDFNEDDVVNYTQKTISYSECMSE